MGHRIDAKIFPKAPSEKAQTTVSENTYTFPKIDVFRTAISSLLAPTGNNERASFLVHQVPHTSATVLRYCRTFTQFSLRVSASEYTCRPIIANLLYLTFRCLLQTSCMQLSSNLLCKLRTAWTICCLCRLVVACTAGKLQQHVRALMEFGRYMLYSADDFAGTLLQD